MLRSASDLQGYAIVATDGEIGRLSRLFFDDERWTVRHLVVDTGKWLPGRHVLISPAAVERIDRAEQQIHLRLTRDTIREAPGVDTDKPVSRQQETALSAYYGYGPYWGGSGLWGSMYYPAGIIGPIPPAGAAYAPPPAVSAPDAVPDAEKDEGDSHLRSTKEVAGYHVQASDESIGHVDDFILEDDTWAIRYLVVDTSNWPGGTSVLISPQWVREIDWRDAKLHVDVTAAQVRSSPEYEPGEVLERAREESLHRHYGKSGYWSDR